MRHAAYLSTSRHGIFYFRWPIPAAFHPQGKRSDVKISLETRSPRTAKHLSRLLVVAGQSSIDRASGGAMRYQDIRQHVHDHFRGKLRQFKERIADCGPIEEDRLEGVRAAQGLAETEGAEFLGHGYPDGLDGFLTKFCADAGIKEELSASDRALFVREIYKAYQTYLAAALDHNASFESVNLDELPTYRTQAEPVKEADRETYSEVVRQYLSEGHRTEAWAAKTADEKEDTLSLLGEIADGKPVWRLTKVDARKVKDVLLRLPKNRRKNPVTRELALDKMLQLNGVEVISPRTVNAYISNLQSFFKWAVNNGHAELNIFDGTRVRISKSTTEQGRQAFKDEQLRLMYHHLIFNPDGLVKKDDHKWPTLIAMFSGMRLNEVAQLQPDDVRRVDNVWCFDVNTTGDPNKSLKNHSSHRLVPVHAKLIDAGLLALVDGKRTDRAARLFPTLTYSKQNGYGRNAGRWFNDSFLPALGIPKSSGLVFHCMRHTMVTQLGQKDIAEPIVKAIVGHTQAGVTYNSYFKAGFRPSQLLHAICQFGF